MVGTGFDPHATRVGNEELESWLLRLLEPKIDFRFFTLDVDGSPVVLMEIARAARHPVRFSGQELIRVGSYKKNLKDFPEKERALWRIFDRMPFEDGIAVERATGDDVLHLLDYPAYFDLLERPLPANRDGILEALASERLIHASDAGGWDITNLGEVLFAKRLDAFGTLRRKAVRVIQYRGNGRTQTLREQEGAKGYACGFEGLIGYINGLLPANEIIEQALRKSVPMFPELAVRELVANALIHQDLFVTGAGPMVEIFDDCIEITNPGEPLVDTQRFVDTPPKSRNEALASLMRRPDLRGAGQRDRQGGAAGRAVPAPGAALRAPGGVHAGGPVCPQVFVRHGRGGQGACLLPTGVPLLRYSKADDQHDFAGKVRGGRAQPFCRLPTYPGGGGGPGHCPRGPRCGAQAHAVPALLGRWPSGGACMIRVLDWHLTGWASDGLGGYANPTVTTT